MMRSAMQTLTFVILAGAAVLEAYSATNYCGCHVEFPYVPEVGSAGATSISTQIITKLLRIPDALSK